MGHNKAQLAIAGNASIVSIMLWRGFISFRLSNGHYLRLTYGMQYASGYKAAMPAAKAYVDSLGQ